jgi:hypothetical protein
MSVPLKSVFDQGKPLAPQLDAEWLRTVADALNSLNVAGGAIDKSTGEWTITVPAAGSLDPFKGASVAGIKFPVGNFSGMTTEYARVYFDAQTYPAYTTEADYNSDWPSDYVVIKISTVQGWYILPRG